MEIDSDTIVSSESYNKYGMDERRKGSAERVKRFMDRGKMTRAKILERFTEGLTRLATEAMLSNIENRFQQICDPQTGYISQQRFSDIFSNRFQTCFLWLPDALSVLYRIVAWHASFPFPPFDPPAIDHNGFLRAINLLTLNPPPYFNHRQHGVSTGEWGPHSGGLVKLRGKDDQDLRRRLFRSLADPTLTETAPENAHALTKIPTPRFFMYQPREKRPADTSTLEEDEDSDDPGQQVVVVAEEDERCIDLLDVVSAYPPGEDPLTSNPLRESYESILLTLPQQPYYLHEMQIPSLKLVDLFRLLAVVDPNDGNGQEEKEILEWTEQLLESATPDQTSYISWPEFDRGLCKSQQHCFRILSSLMSVFKTPVDH